MSSMYCASSSNARRRDFSRRCVSITQLFGLTRQRLARAKKDVLIMHPGPINRGVEIDSDVADGEHSVILEQVTYGVAVRMAVVYLLSGGEAVEV